MRCDTRNSALGLHISNPNLPSRQRCRFNYLTNPRSNCLCGWCLILAHLQASPKHHLSPPITRTASRIGNRDRLGVFAPTFRPLSLSKEFCAELTITSTGYSTSDLNGLLRRSRISGSTRECQCVAQSSGTREQSIPSDKVGGVAIARQNTTPKPHFQSRKWLTETSSSHFPRLARRECLRTTRLRQKTSGEPRTSKLWTRRPRLLKATWPCYMRKSLVFPWICKEDRCCEPIKAFHTL